MANTSFGLLVFCFKFLPTADMAAASFDQRTKSCLDCVLGQAFIFRCVLASLYEVVSVGPSDGPSDGW